MAWLVCSPHAGLRMGADCRGGNPPHGPRWPSACLVGIPGKAQWKGERGRAWARLLEGVQAYIWQEPDAEIFGESMSCDIPDAKIIVAPDTLSKDVSAAHLAGVDVAQLIDELSATAVPARHIGA